MQPKKQLTCQMRKHAMPEEMGWDEKQLTEMRTIIYGFPQIDTGEISEYDAFLACPEMWTG